MFQQGEKTLPELSNSVTILSLALPLAYFTGSENHNSVAFRAFHSAFRGKLRGYSAALAGRSGSTYSCTSNVLTKSFSTSALRVIV